MCCNEEPACHGDPECITKIQHSLQIYIYICTYPVAWVVKNLPAVQETLVPSLGWEEPLEKGMATHSSILTWRIPWTKEAGGLQSMVS